MPELAKRTSRFSGSASSALNAKIAELRRHGENIIRLNIGEPDFPTPANVKMAGVKAIADDFTKYCPAAGIFDLKEAIVNKFATENNIHCAMNQVTTTVGAKQAIFCALMAVADEGDEVLVPTPCWVSYIDMVKIAAATPVLVPLKEENGYALDVDAIAAKVTPHTKAIIICSPNNPTGAVYDEESLRKLGKLAVEKDFYIIADEIYECLLYDGAKHVSVASLSPEFQSHTITVNGVSKAYAMTGWRLGFATGPANVIKAMLNLQSQSTSATSSISMQAAVEALNGPKYDRAKMAAAYAERKEYVAKRLSALPGIHFADPKGAFYIFPDVSYYFGKKAGNYTINNAMDLAAYILNEYKVAVLPGDAFSEPGHIRISYANSMANLKEAFDRIETALKTLE